MELELKIEVVESSNLSQRRPRLPLGMAGSKSSWVDVSICTDGGPEEVGCCNGGRFKEVGGCIDGWFEEVRGCADGRSKEIGKYIDGRFEEMGDCINREDKNNVLKIGLV